MSIKMKCKIMEKKYLFILLMCFVCQTTDGKSLGGPTRVSWSGCPFGYSHLADESDCFIFYHCFQSPWGIAMVPKTCGPYLMFNPDLQICDWPSRVKSLRPECKREGEMMIVHHLTRIEPSHQNEVVLPSVSQKVISTLEENTISENSHRDISSKSKPVLDSSSNDRNRFSNSNSNPSVDLTTVDNSIERFESDPITSDDINIEKFELNNVKNDKIFGTVKLNDIDSDEIESNDNQKDSVKSNDINADNINDIEADEVKLNDINADNINDIETDEVKSNDINEDNINEIEADEVKSNDINEDKTNDIEADEVKSNDINADKTNDIDANEIELNDIDAQEADNNITEQETNIETDQNEPNNIEDTSLITTEKGQSERVMITSDANLSDTNQVTNSQEFVQKKNLDNLAVFLSRIASISKGTIPELSSLVSVEDKPVVDANHHSKQKVSQDIPEDVEDEVTTNQTRKPPDEIGRTVMPLVNGRFSLDTLNVYTANNKTFLRPDSSMFKKQNSNFIRVNIL